MTTDDSFYSTQAIDDRLRKIELVASQICTERSIRMEHARESGSPGERLTNLERRLEALLEGEAEMSRTPHHETLTETELTPEQEASIANIAKAMHLSPEEIGKLKASLKPARQTHGRDATSEIDSAGLSASNRHTQRALGVTTRQIQTAKRDSLLAEQARLESR